MDWKEAKKQYHEIPVPDELSDRLEKTIREYRPKRKGHRLVWRAAGAAAAVLVLFITGLNTNTAFAAQVQRIPALGQIARLLVFENYVEEDEEKVLNVTIPELKDTGFDDLENRINKEIQMKMNAVIQEAEANAAKYREAYLKTGGDPEKMVPMEIKVDYEIKCSNEQYLSFAVWKSESLASVYYEEYIYNIDLETGSELTLRDLLGPDYIRIASESVKKQIEERGGKDPQQTYWGYGNDADGTIPGFEQIDANQTFYLNEDGKVVLVFEKYSIAPGSMGRPEFVVEP